MTSGGERGGGVTILHGIGVSPGAVCGRVVRLPDRATEPPAGPPPDDREAEAARIAAAAAAVAAELRARASCHPDVQPILEAAAMMAEDPALRQEAERLVREHGLPAARAVWETANRYREQLVAAGGYLAARAIDLDDVRDRLVAALLGSAGPDDSGAEQPYILAARDIGPADTVALRRDLVLGIVIEQGSPTSHTAILARALGIPAVVACSGALDLPEGELVALDGDAGTVATGPDLAAPSRPRRPRRLVGPGRTADGVRIPLLANLDTLEEVEHAVAAGAEGVGLLRTELLFLHRGTEPGVAEQAATYLAIADRFPGRPVVIRTLDIGADKQVPYLPELEEPNPALGLRGLRLAREVRPELLDRQLEAIGRAAARTEADLRVMAPMVAVPEEAAWFAARARAYGLRTVGVMVEVPAAALAAGRLLREVDFVSIGTNDLAQYAFAAERTSGRLARLNDPWQPALLELIRLVGEAGTAAGRPVGVCGEAAADPALAAVLVGLGATSLSMAPTVLPEVGDLLARVTLDQCRAAAEAARAAADPQEARARASAVLGLGP
ncbi:phosphoenolpyruvate--protein phosphotransferase [Carbonactinospora thermoautotrophica]|uniref:phosphoenolpyruvate--protein phosphotransferase n=1 Tax=Carbonactinospora thermoautotrophica TaxID=1469144 RepID=UPI000833469E